MGLSVLVVRPSEKTSFGGKGVTISEVINFLRSTHPKESIESIENLISLNNNQMSPSSLVQENSAAKASNPIKLILSSTPLISGLALSVSFLGK